MLIVFPIVLIAVYARFRMSKGQFACPLARVAAIGLASLAPIVGGCAGVERPHGERIFVAAHGSGGQIAECREAMTEAYGSATCLARFAVEEMRAPVEAASEFRFSHPRIARFVDRYKSQQRASLGSALQRSRRYVARMSNVLRREGVPAELAYLPLIESDFRPHAVSRAGAVGPWQFIASTGRRYGLRIDRYVDERRDPLLSTRAAAKYLKALHAEFGDWHLSLAAYNTGEHAIAQLVARRPSVSFWELSERGLLYAETADFVPKFLAALQIAQSPEAHGFDTATTEPLLYDTVKVSRSLSLATVARFAGTSTRTITELNPALHRGVVPPRGYAVRVPPGTKAAVEAACSGLVRL